MNTKYNIATKTLSILGDKNFEYMSIDNNLIKYKNAKIINVLSDNFIDTIELDNVEILKCKFYNLFYKKDVTSLKLPNLKTLCITFPKNCMQFNKFEIITPSQLKHFNYNILGKNHKFKIPNEYILEKIKFEKIFNTIDIILTLSNSKEQIKYKINTDNHIMNVKEKTLKEIDTEYINNDSLIIPADYTSVDIQYVYYNNYKNILLPSEIYKANFTTASIYNVETINIPNSYTKFNIPYYRFYKIKEIIIDNYSFKIPEGYKVYESNDTIIKLENPLNNTFLDINFYNMSYRFLTNSNKFELGKFNNFLSNNRNIIVLNNEFNNFNLDLSNFDSNNIELYITREKDETNNIHITLPSINNNKIIRIYNSNKNKDKENNLIKSITIKTDKINSLDNNDFTLSFDDNHATKIYKVNNYYVLKTPIDYIIINSNYDIIHCDNIDETNNNTILTSIYNVLNKNNNKVVNSLDNTIKLMKEYNLNNEQIQNLLKSLTDVLIETINSEIKKNDNNKSLTKK